MDAIVVQIDAVRTRKQPPATLITLEVPQESAGAIAGFLTRIGDYVGVAFAELDKFGKVDENPLTEETDKNPSILPSIGDKKSGLLSQWAAMRCKEPEFRAWIVDDYYSAGGKLVEEEGCRQLILNVCKIESRAQLDTNAVAASIFHEEFRKPYAEWLKNRGSVCKKCGGAMIDGQYIEETLSGEPDFPDGEIVTLSPGGPGKISQCRKCVKCGWSAT